MFQLAKPVCLGLAVSTIAKTQNLRALTTEIIYSLKLNCLYWRKISPCLKLQSVPGCEAHTNWT